MLAKLVVVLKAASHVGDYEVTLRLHGPTEQKAPTKIPVKFEEGHSAGVGLYVDLALEVKNFGDCWFDVEWYGELLTRVPFTLAPALLSENKQKRTTQPHLDEGGHRG